VELCDGLIQDNVIADNYKSGIIDCRGLILDNTIWGNEESGISECSGIIRGCILWGNGEQGEPQLSLSATPEFSCVEDWAPDDRGNIADDPRLLDPLGGDFRLAADSPCIDAGSVIHLPPPPLHDVAGEARLVGAQIDMGAHEWGTGADSDGDLLTDAAEGDLGSNPLQCDSDGDGLSDFAETLRGTDPTVADAPVGLSVPGDADSIQRAVFLALPGETITVSPGVYRENLVTHGRGLTLQSIDPLDHTTVDATVILSGLSTVINLRGSEVGSSALRGLTLIGNRTKWYHQQTGIWGQGGWPNVERCVILSVGDAILFAGAVGDCELISNGGFGILGCAGPIEDNTIDDHVFGGISECRGEIRGNTVTHCSWGIGDDMEGPVIGNVTAENRKQGIRFIDGLVQGNTVVGNKDSGIRSCDGVIEGNVIAHNSESWSDERGGGISWSDGLIRNNLIFGNGAEYGGGLHGCDGLIINNTIWGNHSRIRGGGTVTLPRPDHQQHHMGEHLRLRRTPALPLLLPRVQLHRGLD
jgi:Bacterial TSP3 repeat